MADGSTYTRFDPSLIGSDDALDTGMAKRAVENVNHIADQYAQTRIRWTMPSGQTAKSWPSDVPSPAVDTYYWIAASVPLDFHVRLNGGNLETYHCRIRLRGHSKHATHQCTMQAVLAAPGQAALERAIGGVNVSSHVFQSTSLGWSDGSSLIYLDEGRISAFRQDVNTINAIGGSNQRAVWIQAQLTIFAKINNALAAPALAGVELTEYVHP